MPCKAIFQLDATPWLANPEQNFGWILMSQSEDVPFTARRFASREGSTPTPRLVIEYDAAAEPIRLATINVTDGEISLEWEGGNGPFKIERKTSLTAPEWDVVAENLQDREQTLSGDTSQAFFRIVE